MLSRGFEWLAKKNETDIQRDGKFTTDATGWLENAAPPWGSAECPQLQGELTTDVHSIFHSQPSDPQANAAVFFRNYLGQQKWMKMGVSPYLFL